MRYYVYILSNDARTLYIGFTDDLPRRFYEHKSKFYASAFTARYTFNRVVYFEVFDSAEEAMRREKQLKGWRRSRKVELIQSVNPWWADLSWDWMEKLCLD